jgi:hypothetical protein
LYFSGKVELFSILSFLVLLSLPTLTRTVIEKLETISIFQKITDKNWDDPTRQPMVKHAQLFNNGANAYVRITNKTIDATTTNDTDPDSKFSLVLVLNK